jgi:hypothetical protein
LLDGHHRLFPLDAALKLENGQVSNYPGLSPKVSEAIKKGSKFIDPQHRTMVRLNVSEVFQDHISAQSYLDKNHIGYRDGIRVKSAAQFPKYVNITNDPVRSAVGQAIYDVGLNSDHFVPHLEFKARRFLSPSLLSEMDAYIKNGRPILENKDLLSRIGNELNSSPEFSKYLNENYRSGLTEVDKVKAAKSIQGLKQSPDSVLSKLIKACSIFNRLPSLIPT